MERAKSIKKLIAIKKAGKLRPNLLAKTTKMRPEIS